jgi:hypothetical protein
MSVFLRICPIRIIVRAIIAALSHQSWRSVDYRTRLWQLYQISDCNIDVFICFDIWNLYLIFWWLSVILKHSRCYQERGSSSQRQLPWVKFRISALSFIFSIQGHMYTQAFVSITCGHVDYCDVVVGLWSLTLRRSLLPCHLSSFLLVFLSVLVEQFFDDTLSFLSNLRWITSRCHKGTVCLQ